MRRNVTQEIKIKGRPHRWLVAVLCLWIGGLLLAPSLILAQVSPAIQTLLITGQNAHNWPATSAALKQILEDTGLFKVDIVITPSSGAEMKRFRPDFSSHQLIVLDYCGDSWPEPTRRAFVDFVRKGGGVVVYHSADTAFPDWPEYNEIIGLAGGGKRDQKAGPYVFWKDGSLVFDNRPGMAGYPTPPHSFLVINRDTTHPITAGLPETWMHAEDELFGLLRGPAKNLTVLATAYSAPEEAGTGRHEPVLFTVTYGAGRIFHTVLGHARGDGPFPALECVGFIITFQRGAEWAATGRVTQKIPGDFPATDRKVSTPADVRRWPGYRPPSLDSILEAVAGFEPSKNEAVVYRLRDYVHSHKDSAESRLEMEAKFLAFLESGASAAAKMEVCRYLRLIGSESSIPVLNKLLLDVSTTDLARYALEKIPGETVDDVLLKALSQTDGETKRGIIASLGRRQSPSAVAALAELLEDPDRETAAAAAIALGEIATEKASELLVPALEKSRGEFQERLVSSLLNCAEERLRKGEFDQAFLIYDRILSSRLPVLLHQAALRGKIRTASPEQGRKLILEALQSPSPEDDEPAIGLVRNFFDDSSISVITSILSRVSEPNQVELLAVLADYPGREVLPAILEATRSSVPLVRLTALRSLARTGDASLVPFLAERAATSRGQEQEAARASLWSLRGADVDEAIHFELLASASDKVKNELIQAIGARRMLSQKSLLFEFVRSGSLENKLEAARALRLLVKREDLDPLLDLLSAVNEEEVGEEILSTIATLSLKIPDPGERTRPMKERLEPSPNSLRAKWTEPDKRSLLYRLLGRIGCDASLPLLRVGLSQENPDTVDAIVRSLADWPTSTPRHDLLSIARTSANLTHRVLATRGYIRMIGLEKYQSPAGAVAAAELVLPVIERPEEIKLLLATLADFPCGQALRLAESYLSVEEVKEEAQAAVRAIEEQLARRGK
ncbi:MAG: HEAT repeat domain-containing protein [Candidatus Aminicenantales bacterium]